MTAPLLEQAPVVEPQIPQSQPNSTEQFGPRRRPLTAHDYEQMALLGFFEGLRVELIDGEIVEMPPIGEPHAMSVSRTTKRLNIALNDDLLTRPQNPINAGSFGRPEPDVAVVLTSNLVRGEAPSQVELAIEVSDSTLKYDQTDKASLYASLGIQDYWILNLVESTLEVRRQPIPRPSARFGFDYANTQILTRGQSASPLVAPDLTLKVEDLLP